MSDVGLDIPGSRPADAVLAAELALGVLDAGEQARAETRAAQEDGFAAAAADWAARLHPLLESVPPAEPGPELWSRVERHAARGARPPAAVETTVAPTEVQAAPAPERGRRPWRAAAFGAIALAAAALAALATAPRSPMMRAPLLATRLMPAPAGAPVLTPEPLFTVVLDPARAELVLTRARTFPSTGLALWLSTRAGGPRRLAPTLGDGAVIRVQEEALRRAAPGDRLYLAAQPASPPAAQGELISVR